MDDAKKQSTEKIIVEINGQRFSVKPQDMVIPVNGRDRTLGDLLQRIDGLEKQIQDLRKTLTDFVKVDSKALGLISTAHDGLSLKLADLESDVKDIQKKIGGSK